MCTVTILPQALLTALPRHQDAVRWRLACNRDEAVTRPPAQPPVMTRIGTRLAVMPIDPESGGTWVGVNDAGLACALLNVYDGRVADASAALSRGTVVPQLLGFADVDSALMRARQLDARMYRPFRLLICDGRELIECWTGGIGLDSRRQRLHIAVMRTSSGLGDHVVARPRAALFRQFFAAASDPIATEDLFHLHQWRGREDISVRMRRADARTVSHTVIEVREGIVRLAYRAADTPDTISVAVAA